MLKFLLGALTRALYVQYFQLATEKSTFVVSLFLQLGIALKTQLTISYM